jgi:hypothetical protein
MCTSACRRLASIRASKARPIGCLLRQDQLVSNVWIGASPARSRLSHPARGELGQADLGAVGPGDPPVGGLVEDRSVYWTHRPTPLARCHANAATRPAPAPPRRIQLEYHAARVDVHEELRLRRGRRDGQNHGPSEKLGFSSHPRAFFAVRHARHARSSGSGLGLCAMSTSNLLCRQPAGTDFTEVGHETSLSEQCYVEPPEIRCDT